MLTLQAKHVLYADTACNMQYMTCAWHHAYQAMLVLIINHT